MTARVLAVAALAALLLAPPALAAEWGLIRPGVSTTKTVRERYGAPSRTEHVKIDKYDTERWIYEDEKAPSGIVRMTVDFGLVHDDKYRAEVVRVLQLEPHGGTFNRGVMATAGASPTATARPATRSSSSTRMGSSSISPRMAGTSG